MVTPLRLEPDLRVYALRRIMPRLQVRVMFLTERAENQLGVDDDCVRNVLAVGGRCGGTGAGAGTRLVDLGLRNEAIQILPASIQECCGGDGDGGEGECGVVHGLGAYCSSTGTLFNFLHIRAAVSTHPKCH